LSSEVGGQKGKKKSTKRKNGTTKAQPFGVRGIQNSTDGFLSSERKMEKVGREKNLKGKEENVERNGPCE